MLCGNGAEAPARCAIFEKNKQGVNKELVCKCTSFFNASFFISYNKVEIWRRLYESWFDWKSKCW